MGFKYNPSELRFILSVILFVASMVWFLFQKNKYDKFILAIIILFVSIPNFISYYFQGGDVRIVLWSFFLIIITSGVLKVFPVIKLPTLRDAHVLYFLCLLLVVCMILVVHAHGIKFNLKVFLFDVYDVRRESRLHNTFASVYAYFWLAKVILPICILYSLDRKNKILFIISIFCLLFLFMTTGHKSVFFTVFIMLVFYVGKDDFLTKTIYFVKYACLAFIVFRLLTIFFDFSIFESLLIRRVLFIPALLNIYFFDFFHNNFIYYSNSYLSPFLDYPFDKEAAKLIGYYYFHSEEMSANNGYLSDGFANFGDVGVFINVIFTAFVLKLFKDYDVPAKYSGLIFVTFYAIQGSSFSTFLFTHGGLLLILLIPFSLSRKNVS
ncbi:TPA: hypothetical protein ACX6Q7_002924 [Photobacterium damselae]